MKNSLPSNESKNLSEKSGRFKSLVVEDDFSCRVLLQGLLSKYGECHIALSGKEAIKVFQGARRAHQAYDLICMDIQMPEMNGQEAVTRIRALEDESGGDSPEVKILMTTSSRDATNIFHSFNAKCDGYLIKPIDGVNLAKCLVSLGLLP